MEDSLLQIGRGTYGTVYLDSLQKNVIKKIEKFDTSGTFLYHTSTIREIVYLCNLDHSNIVKLHKITLDKYNIYLHLSYCGYSLLDLYTKDIKPCKKHIEFKNSEEPELSDIPEESDEPVEPINSENSNNLAESENSNNLDESENSNNLDESENSNNLEKADSEDSNNLDESENSEDSEDSDDSKNDKFNFDIHKFKTNLSNFADKSSKFNVRDEKFQNRLKNVPKIISSILEILIYLNYNNLSYNDMKPDNIMIYNSEVYLIDLAFIKITKDNSSTTNNNFKAPELFYNIHSFNSDIYSLAMCVYFYIYGIYLEDLIKVEKKHIVKESFYIDFYKQIQKENIYLELCNIGLDLNLCNFLNKMTILDYNNRTNALQLYFSDYLKPYTKPLKLHKHIDTIHNFTSVYNDNKIRIKYINKKLNFLQSINMTHIYHSSVYIFDLFCSSHSVKDTFTMGLISCCSLVIASSIFDTSLKLNMNITLFNGNVIS